ncbi:MAG: CBS domain-containing protein [Candidatus Sumerlaeia bacterium]|nr:CBS domain-containing protein [Candidatus Sumerlaeia bacterium]
MPNVQTLLDRKGRDVATIHVEGTVLDAARKMNELRIGALVIVDDQDRLAGIFTERDILTRIVAKEIPPSEAIVGDYMTTDPVTTGADATLDECGRLMTTRRVRHLPIVENKKVVGLVSIGDLTRHEIETREQTIQDLKDYMYRG